ncbi:hypothetical protein KM043_007172 [Ampulex compressa]|nr:hypothetical protein KM043_007172 [Ampulex compressa]
MNSNDISRLSYKELQALALRYRVPANIKKKLLIKVLQAAKIGNEYEVRRLLQDLKHNRKKRVKRIKSSKLGITSTPLHSPNYVMADDYCCPQQQPPYQWVGAEEEIREFQMYDANNNQVQESGIVDLRTAAVPDIHSVPIENNNCSKSHIIGIGSASSLICPSTEHVKYQVLEDSNGNSQGSLLLKKMLQAPVGANLGEIASPIFGGYQFCSMEQYQSNSLLDNSDTLTAESESNDNEDNFENNTECYSLLNNVKDEYFLNQQNYSRNIGEVGQQMSRVLTNENTNQYTYTCTNFEMHQDNQNWAVTNVIEEPETGYVESDMQSSKMFQAMSYDNAEPNCLSKSTNNETVIYQYHVAENVDSYNSNQNVFHCHPHEETHYYNTDMITSAPSDTSNIYYLQNLVKHSADNNGENIHPLRPFSRTNIEQNTYTSVLAQTFSADNHYNFGFSYEYPYVHNNQEDNVPLLKNLTQQQQCSDGALRHEDSAHKEFALDRVQSSLSGVLDSFWPKWRPANSSEVILENTLNLCRSKRVDYSKLDQTSCVYCYIAPVVTQKPVLSTITCSQDKRFMAEHRQHAFSPYWLLYNDTSWGMRMANLQSSSDETIADEIIEHTTLTSNSNVHVKEMMKETEDSINETWIRSYTNYDVVMQKDINIGEVITTETSDSLFSVMNAEPLDSQIDSMSTS